MSTWTRPDVLSLSIADRLQLIEDIWDSIAEVPEELHLSEAQKVELDRRLELYHRNPDQGSPWEEVKERIRSRK